MLITNIIYIVIGLIIGNLLYRYNRKLNIANSHNEQLKKDLTDAYNNILVYHYLDEVYAKMLSIFLITSLDTIKNIARVKLKEKSKT